MKTSRLAIKDGNPPDGKVAEVLNKHCPRTQKVVADDGTARSNPQSWEPLAGAWSANDSDRATAMRTHSRVFSRTPADNCRSSVERPAYQFSRVGRFTSPSCEWVSCASAVFYGTAAWSAGLTPRFDSNRRQCTLAEADPIEAFSKADGANLR